MILVDDPSNRHMCPVTLFLALAIADGALEGVHPCSGLAALHFPDWPGWLQVPYSANATHLPVIRRTGNKSRVLSSCAMKPSSLDKMMQGQIERAKHVQTFAMIVQDVRKATQREKRREST